MAKSVVDGHGPPAERDAGQLALDRETMRELGYRTVDMLVDRMADETVPPLRRGTPAEMAERLGGPAPADPKPFDEILTRLEEDVLAFTSRLDHPSFFAFIPSCGTWPSALGGLRRERVQHLRGLVDGVGGPDPGRARGAGLVQGLGGLSGDGRRQSPDRRLRGQHDRPRVRAREAGRADVGPADGLRLRPVAQLAGAGRARARLPARPGARGSDGHVAAPPSGGARLGDGRRPARRPHPVVRRRERWRDERRDDRRAAGAR